jgi:predicted nucleotide-binding protein
MNRMTRRPASPVTQQAQLTTEKMRIGINRIERCLAEIETFDPAGSSSQPELIAKAGALDASVHSALDQTFGHATVEEQRYSEAASFSHAMMYSAGYPVRELVPGLLSVKGHSQALLAQAITFLKEELELALPTAQQSATAVACRKPSRKVFVVHGHDDAAKNEVALFLSSIGLQPIILHARPHGGRHILTKFQEESEDAGFAVILMTPDDEGMLVGETSQKRARQNVVFELGFFIGRLGTPNVAALIRGDIERPSDFDGIGYIEFDSRGEWKRLLGREMHHAQIPFDATKVLTA